QAGVFASRFPAAGHVVWTLVNRNESAMAGEQISVRHVDGTQYFDLWNGLPLDARIEQGEAVVELPLEAHGFAALLAVLPGAALEGLDAFLARMRGHAATPLQALSDTWTALPQALVAIADTRAAPEPPDGMVTVPAGQFVFAVGGVEIEGQRWDGVDVQYPWEPSARRGHRHRMAMRPFHIDRFPVTNADFRAFLDASGWRPRDAHNFLRHWHNGAPVPGSERQPVRWVGIEDARAYADWAGKRLPREWEWQYAAQGTDGRRYPWGDDWRADAVPAPCLERTMRAPDDVDAHPSGASPFGVQDLVGNLWQWTDEYRDAHTRAAVLRGGSLYRPQTSHWYFPQAHRLDQHGKYLLMAPCKDRSGAVGFRCVVDAG
ncbi:MAG TPA: formylglycine-generating enzyme family protein, partial [Luteimonas sp.]|nr:formylglycine-generating enzyme family protein [Luteimonas sp.]